MNSEYLNAVKKKLSNSPQKSEITEELMSHICDKRDYYLELGYDEKEAIRRADEDMGDPDDCAVPLNALHPAGSRAWLISVICILLILLPISFIFMDYFAYSANYHLPLNEIWFVTVHNIEADFISLSAVALFVGILIYNNKRKNAGVSVVLILFLGFYFFLSAYLLSDDFDTISEFSAGNFFRCASPMFNPFFYAVITIFSKGFDGYVNSIFAYEKPEPSSAYMWGATVLTILMITWAVLQFVSIIKQKKMKNNRIISRILKITSRVVCGLLTVNFAVMTVCTAIAVQQTQVTINENKNKWASLIDYTVSAQLEKPSAEITAPLKAQFEEEQTYYGDSGKIYCYSNHSNDFGAEWYPVGAGDESPMLMVNVYDKSNNILNWFGMYSRINSYNTISQSEATQLSKMGGSESLQDFMTSDLCYKAISVVHQYGLYDAMIPDGHSAEEYANGESIYFEYDVTDHTRIRVCFYSAAQGTKRNYNSCMTMQYDY